MQKIGVFTKVLAVTGFVLAGLPIVAPVFFSLILYASERIFRFDYLMPAELLLFLLVGGALLLWAALRARVRVKQIAWSLGLAPAVLIVGQAIAILTGLASGAAEPAGWKWILVLAFLVLYDLIVIALAVGGFLLVKDLFQSREPGSSSD